MSTRIPQVSFVFNRHKNASLIKKAAVEIRISHNYKPKYISTGVMLYSNQWRNGQIVNTSEATTLSQILEKYVTDVRQIVFEMITSKNIDVDAIPDKLKALYGEKLSFIGFCRQRAEVRKYGIAKDSKKRYNRFIRLFTAWGKIKNFEDVNEASIIEYDEYLSSSGMKPYSKWNNYHRFLQAFIKDAIDAGYLRKNPYKWLNITKRKSISKELKYLTPEEFKQIQLAPMPDEKLSKVRDLFVFQTYTCLSYIDLKDFDSSKIQEVKGMQVYVGVRQKTKTAFTIPLFSPALNIIHKYEGMLPIITNQKYNDYLKLVAVQAKVNRPLSSHWARHTGATMLLNEGVDMRIVSKICGHSSIKMTEQIYAKLLDETVVEAIKTVMDK